MRINLTVGEELRNSNCIITKIYPHFVMCETPDKRIVSFNVGDIVSNQLDSRPIWEQEDDYFLDHDSYVDYYRAV